MCFFISFFCVIKNFVFLCNVSSHSQNQSFGESEYNYLHLFGLEVVLTTTLLLVHQTLLSLSFQYLSFFFSVVFFLQQNKGKKLSIYQIKLNYALARYLTFK